MRKFAAGVVFLGSARVSRVGCSVSLQQAFAVVATPRKVRDGEDAVATGACATRRRQQPVRIHKGGSRAPSRDGKQMRLGRTFQHRAAERSIHLMSMNWIRAHYDRVAVLAAALFLFCSALLIIRNVAQFGETFRVATAPARSPRCRHPKQSRWTKPPRNFVSRRSGRLAAGRDFSFRKNISSAPNGLPATLQTTEVHPPVPNEWLEQFGLPIADADVLTQDPDGDGFSNVGRMDKGTPNPTDKNSRPAFIAKLKMKSFSAEPFRMIFASSDGDTFGINTIDLKEPTQFLKIGRHDPGSRFKIVKFAEKS